nr:immunoglobulin light chain junction region [Macaca mulatta]
YMQSLEFPLTF